MEKAEILNKLPYGKGFLFVDDLLSIDETGVTGSYTYSETLPFYESHFTGFPVTPAVILTETMAQIGLVCLGIYLLRDRAMDNNFSVVMTSSAIDFIKPVFPGEKVVVTSEKVYFRFNKLSCKVKMENANGETVCKGNISGMLIVKSDD
ncbi:3-hydroxyacyl-ACP dehydratase FabZ family protein [Pedobacter endophyticus]|uniref:Beta-hydroxyacyl-ACP dehydratase n=1 Tax=Pedobacter endophyticus TaxID=2789740 RepID=A0A7S9KZ58_9SPHI|nr:3-hydroxyacyl-ACP dehydratase FabZ family protein [Pedobacter endophyticus]QPH39540.1 beta-hydroxyacyl-ACP dehydratase [Pedobacter endophyticus]